MGRVAVPCVQRKRRELKASRLCYALLRHSALFSSTDIIRSDLSIPAKKHTMSPKVSFGHYVPTPSVKHEHNYLLDILKRKWHGQGNLIPASEEFVYFLYGIVILEYAHRYPVNLHIYGKHVCPVKTSEP